MPKNSTIASRATDLIAKTWMNIGEYYNPTLYTLGGPWDRTYGFDMVRKTLLHRAQISDVSVAEILLRDIRCSNHWNHRWH